MTLADRLMLAASYILLVAVVVATAWRLEVEFDRSHHERCLTLKIELELLVLQTAALAPEDLGVPSEREQTLLNKIHAEIDELCG